MRLGIAILLLIFIVIRIRRAALILISVLVRVILLNIDTNDVGVHKARTHSLRVLRVLLRYPLQPFQLRVYC